MIMMAVLKAYSLMLRYVKERWGGDVLKLKDDIEIQDQEVFQIALYIREFGSSDGFII